VTEFTCSINILELDILVQFPTGLGHKGLSQDKRSLLGSNTTSLDHNVIVSDNTVVGEATHGGNILLGQIAFSGGIVLCAVSLSLSHSVDSLIALSSVVVPGLTGSGNGVGDFTGMPRPDTTDLSQTSMSLSGELSDAPSLCDTGETLTLCDSDNINDFVSAEDLVDFQIFLELAFDKVDFLINGTSVNLDFHNVGLFGPQVTLQMDLGVANGSNGTAEFPDSLFSDLLEQVLIVDVFGEGLFLGGVPVLVESSLELVGEGVGPDCAQGSAALDSFDVSDETDDLKGRGFDDCDGLDDFLLVESGVDSVDISGDVGHTSLETSKCSEVGLLAGVVFGEGPDLSSMLPGSLSW